MSIGGHSGCAKNAEKNSLKKTGDRLLKLLKPLLKKQAGDNDFTRLGSVRYDGDPLDWENFRQPARRKRTISKKSAEQELTAFRSGHSARCTASHPITFQSR